MASAGTEAQRAGVAIIGAGVIGAAIAHELGSFGVDTLVFEAAAGSATGALRNLNRSAHGRGGSAAAPKQHEASSQGRTK